MSKVKMDASSPAKRVTSRSANLKAAPTSSHSRGAKKSVASSRHGKSAKTVGEDIRRYSLDDLRKMRQRGEVVETRPDATKFDPPEEFWKTARVVRVAKTTSVHLRVDSYVLDFFREQGKGHLTRMNAVLRGYYEAHRKK